MKIYHVSVWPQISGQDQDLLNIMHNATIIRRTLVSTFDPKFLMIEIKMPGKAGCKQNLR